MTLLANILFAIMAMMNAICRALKMIVAGKSVSKRLFEYSRERSFINHRFPHSGCSKMKFIW